MRISRVYSASVFGEQSLARGPLALESRRARLPNGLRRLGKAEVTISTS
jgi:hypothetical protein